MRKKKQSKRLYTTSEICDMYSLSASGLRFFEEKGLISPERDRSSRYRVFTLTECSRLFLCRILRQFGFSTDESVQLVLHGTQSDYSQSLQERSQALEEEIRYKQALLDELKRSQEMLSRIAKKPPVHILQCPTMLRLTCSKNEYFQQWYAALPFSAASLEINRDSLLDPGAELSYTLGFIIESARAADFGLSPNEDTTILPARRCLYTILSYSDTLDNIEDVLSPVLESISAMGFVLAGNPFTRMLGALDMGSGSMRFDEAWFPIALAR